MRITPADRKALEQAASDVERMMGLDDDAKPKTVKLRELALAVIERLTKEKP